MYATSVILSAAVALTSLDVSLPTTTRLDHHFICQDPPRPIFDPDDGSGRSFEQDKPRIDRFANEMKENNTAEAYIIAYGGLVSYKNEARTRLNCTRNYLITVHGISRSRLKLFDGGYRNEVTVQMFLVNPDDPKPTPYATVNREAVRIKKSPKRTCR